MSHLFCVTLVSGSVFAIKTDTAEDDINVGRKKDDKITLTKAVLALTSIQKKKSALETLLEAKRVSRRCSELIRKRRKSEICPILNKVVEFQAVICSAPPNLPSFAILFFAIEFTEHS